MKSISSFTSFTIADFNRLGRQSGFQYRLPHASMRERESEDLCVAEGRIDELEVRPGLNLVTSDITVHHHYEAISHSNPYFSVIVLLQGQASLEHDARFELRAQGGISTSYTDALPMTGIHCAGQRLRSVNLSVASPDALGDEQSCELMARTVRSNGMRMRPWQVQTHLVLAIEHMFDSIWSGTLKDMLREGVSLQLLAHGLSSFNQQPSTTNLISPRDRQMLERVRQKLHETPGEEHSLMDLARLACMSPSTLRAKFRSAYRCSVFNWLRERRMEVAREHLAQGWSVQQAAHYVGYRHATNFATAFRQRYGIPPSRLTRT